VPYKHLEFKKSFGPFPVTGVAALSLSIEKGEYELFNDFYRHIPWPFFELILLNKSNFFKQKNAKKPVNSREGLRTAEDRDVKFYLL